MSAEGTCGKDSACVLFGGAVDRFGYGRQSVDGRTVGAHRVAWGKAFGPIPIGAHVLHECDNPRCINPAHLFLGTPLSNARDKVSKGRHVFGERAHNAKLTKDAVAIIRAGGVCQRQATALYGIGRSQFYRVRNGEQWSAAGNAREGR